MHPILQNEIRVEQELRQTNARLIDALLVARRYVERSQRVTERAEAQRVADMEKIDDALASVGAKP